MSKFKSFFSNGETKNEETVISIIETQEEINEALTPDEIIKKSGIKVKGQIPTDFGIQYELYKKTDIDSIKEILKDHAKLLSKGNYIFILN